MNETPPSHTADAAASGDLHGLLGELITTAHRLTRLAAHETKRSESPATWRTLAVLTTMGPMRLGELARQSRVSQPTMTKIVRGLDDLDWVKRIVDSDDARASQIAATPAGERALSDWRDALAAALLPYFQGLSSDDERTLRRAVEILRESAAVASPGSDRGFGE